MGRYRKECIICKKSFEARVNHAKYCSSKCRNYPELLKGREKAGVIKVFRTCPVCGKNFETYLKRQVYCGKECYSKAVRETYEKRNMLGLRFSILVRDNFTCQYCGRTPQDGILLHVDHIKPKSKGGEDIQENLVSSCEECNLGKSNTHFGEILTYLKNKDFNIIKEVSNEM